MQGVKNGTTIPPSRACGASSMKMVPHTLFEANRLLYRQIPKVKQTWCRPLHIGSTDTGSSMQPLKKAGLFSISLALLAFLSNSEVLCQERQRKLMLFRESSDTQSATQTRPTVTTDVATGVGTVLEGMTTRSGIFDNFYIDGVRRLQIEANPTRNPNDFDERVLSRAGQRVFTVQATDMINSTLNNSELRETYRQVVKTLQKARDTVKFSVRSDQDGYHFTQKPKGAKLVEFHLEPNDQTVVAPHLTLIDTGRLRYDPSRKAVLFEIRRDW